MNSNRSLFASAVAVLVLMGAPIGAHAASDVPIYMQEFDAFRGKTLEQKVQELADREEIRELISRYAHRAAHGESMADLFTDDGTFIVRSGGKITREVHGRKDIDAYFNDLATRPDHPLPMIHNQLLSISGNEATGIASNEIRGVTDGKSMIGSGYYQDRFRRVNGRWKVVSRDFTMFHNVPLQEGWAKPAAPK